NYPRDGVIGIWERRQHRNSFLLRFGSIGRFGVMLNIIVTPPTIKGCYVMFLHRRDNGLSDEGFIGCRQGIHISLLRIMYQCQKECMEFASPAKGESATYYGKCGTVFNSDAVDHETWPGFAGYGV